MWEVVVMGSAQDEGIPRVTCTCARCHAARRNRSFARTGPSILLKNESLGSAVLIDASPDIRQQLDAYLPPLGLAHLSCLFLTHGHIGHYWGLCLFGKEGPDIRDLAVYGSAEMIDLLLNTPSIKYMVDRRNIVLNILRAGETVTLGTATRPDRSDEIVVKGFWVPHRQEFTPTMGFQVTAGSRTMVYIPDVDYWSESVLSIIQQSDIALLDGTFYSADELPGAKIVREVPHPPIESSMGRLKEIKNMSGCRIYFTHFNHTNPVILEGPEQEKVKQAGFELAYDGLRFFLP